MAFEYSLGLYEKAIPVGLSFPKMFEITKTGGFDRFEISIDETDWRRERLDWSPEKQRELGVLARAFETPIRTMCLSGHRKFPFGSHDPEVREKSMEYVNLVNSPWLGVYPDRGNLKNAAVLYGHDVVDDMKTGAGHIFAIHLKETKPGVYRDMNFGHGGHTEYERSIQAGLEMGVRTYTGEFWYQEG